MMRLSGLSKERPGTGFSVVFHGDADGSAVAVPFDAVGEVALFAEGVDMADGGAGGAADVGGVLFELVEFFEDVEGDDDLVVGEGEEGCGIVQQHVGVEDEIFDGGGGFFGHSELSVVSGQWSVAGRPATG